MFDAACIGISVADVITRNVDSLPEKGKLELVDSIDIRTGGCALNAAIDMGILGIKPALVSCIGDDGFGVFIKNEIHKHGIDSKSVYVDRKNSTSSSIVLIDSTGERTFLHYIGANSSFSNDKIDMDIIRNSRYVFIAGGFLMPGYDGKPCAELLKKASDAGKTTILDVAWDSTGKWMETLMPCMQHIDIFMPSYEEAVELSGTEKLADIANKFIGMGVKDVIIKLGKDGCYIKTNNNEEHLVPTYTDIKPIDTTGAGDSFCAGYITGLVKGMSKKDAARFANAVGGHCIQAVGASKGIKSYNEIIDFMKSKDI